MAHVGELESQVGSLKSKNQALSHDVELAAHSLVTIKKLNADVQSLIREVDKRDSQISECQQHINSLTKANEARAIQTFLGRLELLRQEMYPKKSHETGAYEPDEEETKIWKHLASQSNFD